MKWYIMMIKFISHVIDILEGISCSHDEIKYVEFVNNINVYLKDNDTKP